MRGFLAAPARRSGRTPSTPIPNSDSVPREFFPGCPSGADTTGASGSADTSGAPANDVPAGQVTRPDGA